MNDDTNLDLDLSLVQWDALKALRVPAPNRTPIKAYVIESLVALGLVVDDDGAPAITRAGRKVLVRGSCRLLDLVA
jgi:hypothetical protein